MTLAILLLLKAAVSVIIFSVGLGSKPADATWLLHRPALLLRSLLAMYVLVPLAAVILVKSLTLAPGVEIGLLVLAVSAGAPLLPRKLLGVGNSAGIFSLVVMSSVLAILAVPAWLAVLGPYFNAPPHLTPVAVAEVLAKSFFGPLLAGMVVRWLLPAIARRLATLGMNLAGAALLLGALALLVVHWQIVLTIRWNGVLALIALIVMALAIGHIFGGPTESGRTTLAIACATRHIGIAVLVATSLPGPRTAVILSVYIAASAAVSLPYLRWRQAAVPRSRRGKHRGVSAQEMIDTHQP